MLQDSYRCKDVQEYYRVSADVQGYKGGRVKEYIRSTRGEWVQE